MERPRFWEQPQAPYYCHPKPVQNSDYQGREQLLFKYQVSISSDLCNMEWYLKKKFPWINRENSQYQETMISKKLLPCKHFLIKLYFGKKKHSFKTVGTMFTAALFTVAKIWKEVLINRQVDKEDIACAYRCIHTYIHMHNGILLSLKKKMKSQNSLAAQWLGQCAVTAADPSSIPGQRTKIPQAAGHSQNNR